MRAYKNYIFYILPYVKPLEISANINTLNFAIKTIPNNDYLKCNLNQDSNQKNNEQNQFLENSIEKTLYLTPIKDLQIIKNISEKDIIDLYMTFKELSNTTTRYFLISKKYEQLYNKNLNLEDQNKSNKYLAKFKDKEKEIISFFINNQQKLQLLLLANKIKEIKIDEELFKLMYNYTNNLVRREKRIKKTESKTIYLKNKQNKETKEDLINKKIIELQDEIEQIKQRNIANKNLGDVDNQKKLPKSYMKIYKTLSQLVEKSCYSQTKIEGTDFFFYLPKNEINNLKTLIKNNHLKTVKFITKHKPIILEMINSKFMAEYSDNFILFSPSILKNQLDFIRKTDFCMQSILQGKIVQPMQEIKSLIMKDMDNSFLKKKLKKIIEIQNL